MGAAWAFHGHGMICVNGPIRCSSEVATVYKHHTVKAQGVITSKFPKFLISALYEYEGEGFASRSGCLLPKERVCSNHWTGGCFALRSVSKYPFLLLLGIELPSSGLDN